MQSKRESIHGQWSSRLMFILAATGSAVGLGNIWKFPYITGENGGGAFVLVYLLCIAVIGIPIMMGEILIGRRGRRSPINAMEVLAKEEGHAAAWRYMGWMGVIAGFLIMSYYSVIAGWALAYIFRAGAGSFTGADAEQVGQIFSTLISDPEKLIAWHTLFVIVTTAIVARGVAGGLEKAIRWLMPGLLLILLLLVGYALNTGHFGEAVNFLFAPDFDKLSTDAVLVAMGHAFFTLSLGMGAIMIYGSYLPQSASIAGTTLIIAIADTLVALLAGLAIFPLVFANGLEPGAGAGLIFQTLPIAFGQMTGGALFGALFFVLLSFAALSSAISLLEPAVAWLVESRGHSRVQAATWIGMGAWLLGLGTVFSFNLAAEITLFDKTFFDLMDYLTSNILLPLGGLLIAIFAGWVMQGESTRDELQIRLPLLYFGWRMLVTVVAPLAVIIVFLEAVGLLGYVTDVLSHAAAKFE